MGIGFVIKGNLQRLSKELKSIDNKLISGEFLESTAQLINGAMQTRVQREGKGVDGSKMIRYTDLYATKKANSGRNTSFRDLTFSGKMWQSLTTSKGKNKAKMFFGNAESVNKASGNNKRTRFFGLGEKEKKILKDRINILVADL